MTVSRAKRADLAVRRAKLVQYRLEGRRYDDIYEELGYSSAHVASRDFNRTLEANIAEQRTSMEVYREAGYEPVAPGWPIFAPACASASRAMRWDSAASSLARSIPNSLTYVRFP